MLNKPLALLFVLVNHCVFPVYAGGAVPSGKEKPMIVKLTLHQQSYDVELADNPTAKAFIKQLPLTLTMQELNGNEKFAALPHPLPPIPSALKPSIRGISCYTVVILLFFFTRPFAHPTAIRRSARSLRRIRCKMPLGAVTLKSASR